MNWAFRISWAFGIFPPPLEALPAWFWSRVWGIPKRIQLAMPQQVKMENIRTQCMWRCHHITILWKQRFGFSTNYNFLIESEQGLSQQSKFKQVNIDVCRQNIKNEQALTCLLTTNLASHAECLNMLSALKLRRFRNFARFSFFDGMKYHWKCFCENGKYGFSDHYYHFL